MTSVRDTIHTWLVDNIPITPSRADRLLDAYAHELAEKIRAAVYDWDWNPEDSASLAWSAADLIDPEVPDE